MKINKNDYTAYEGSIKLQKRWNNTVIEEKVYHNAGGLPLFQFLCQALRSGSMSAIDSLRPRYLKIFNVGNPGSAVPTNFVVGQDDSTVPEYISDTPEIISTFDKTTFDSSTCAIKFKFIVPYSHIVWNTETPDKAPNAFALYSTSAVNSNDWSSYCAYFYILDGNKLGKLSKGAAENDLDYNIFVEWTLTFKNPTTTISKGE